MDAPTLPPCISRPTSRPTSPADGLLRIRPFLGLLLLCIAIPGTASAFQALGWGDNSAGQLNFPTNLTYNAIAAGGFQSLLIRSDGSVLVYAAPSNSLVMPTNAQSIIALASGYSHGLALLSNNTLFAFGNNDHGQMTIPGGFTNFIAIGAGAYHSLGVLPDGTVISWGDNYQNHRLVPQGLSNVVAVAGGYYHSLALRSDGTIVAWGLNGDGQVSVPPGAFKRSRDCCRQFPFRRSAKGRDGRSLGAQ